MHSEPSFSTLWNIHGRSQEQYIERSLETRSSARVLHKATLLTSVGKQQFAQAKNLTFLHIELFFVNSTLIHICEPDNKHFR